jgi:hypothetical protein
MQFARKGRAVEKYKSFCNFFGLLQLILCCAYAVWWIAQQLFVAVASIAGRLVTLAPPWIKKAFVLAVIINGLYLTVSLLMREIRAARAKKRFINEMKAKGYFRDYLK